MSDITQFKSDVINAFVETHNNNLPVMIQIPGALIIGKIKTDFITAEELSEKLNKLDSEDFENQPLY